HGGDQGHARGVFRFDHVNDGGGVKTADHDLGKPHHDRGVSAAPAVGVEERDRVELHVVVGVDEGGADGERVEVERAVGQHDALGRAGGAAGVEELADSGFVDGEKIGAGN